MKKLIGFTIIGSLVSILVFNIIQDAQQKKEDTLAQEEYVLRTEADGSYADFLNEGLSKGDIPPDFQLTTLTGEEVQLSELNGKKVILNFWATWCPPCRAEMPHMENFYKTKAAEYDVEIVAVNLTKAEQGMNVHEKIKDFINEYDLTFIVPLDQEGKVEEQYQIIPIPTTFFIGSNGLIAKKIIGPMDEKMIESILKEMT